ncbi:ribosomal protein L5 domain-containing protein [Cantharellus anzutake]|uniref:ribosomal protein L5 domain-containing protein n=1 Tax=Cantharellus anzutake TaxID=1750568 RepID=UPI00190646E4|nr:ribosomal protein L5 domain-containing protein [Cantharellus anzutake]KAF8333557.1 ribosomal protein L5 domain-containing protein [Cantharellus anzutake]
MVGRWKPRHILRIPPVHIQIGPTHPSRLASHYNNTLVHDLLYLHYSHTHAAHATHGPNLSQLDPSNPYQSNRKLSPLKGNRPPRPSALPISTENVTRLERIILHTMVKEAVTSKNALVSAAMAFKALSGESYHGGGNSNSLGVQIIKSKSGVAEFKVRAGLQISAQVELRGEKMWEFVGSLVDFVLPKLRDFRGIPMPSPSSSSTSPSAVSGVVAFGLPPTAMGLFPQIEVNVDSYPRLPGIHIQFITNARGKGAQDRARALLSGLRIPFIRG